MIKELFDSLDKITEDYNNGFITQFEMLSKQSYEMKAYYQEVTELNDVPVEFLINMGISYGMYYARSHSE